MIEPGVDRTSTGGRDGSGRPIALILWYVLMAIGGAAFGLIGDRRPFGESLLFHPLLMFFILVSVALLTLRTVLARPVPDIISDRALAVGCLLGLATFLAGNFLETHLFAR